MLMRTASYRFDCPRAIFLTFFFFDPRGSVRFALGAAFLRAARFSFFRSSLSSILVVSATWFLFRFYRFWDSRRWGDSSLMLTGISRRRKRAVRGAMRVGTGAQALSSVQ